VVGVQKHRHHLEFPEVFRVWWKGEKIRQTNHRSKTYSAKNRIEKNYLCIDTNKSKRLTGVSGKKLIESQPIPGTWILPGVLQVACNALRALRFGDFGTAPFEHKTTVFPGTFSLPVAEVEAETQGAELPPLVVCLLSVM
jgi:hypothetical protein